MSSERLSNMPEVTQQAVEPGSTQVVQLLSGPAQDKVRPPGSPGSRRAPLLGLWSGAQRRHPGAIPSSGCSAAPELGFPSAGPGARAG